MRSVRPPFGRREKQALRDPTARSESVVGKAFNLLLWRNERHLGASRWAATGGTLVEAQKCNGRPIAHSPVGVFKERDHARAPSAFIARGGNLKCGRAHRPIIVREGLLDDVANLQRIV